MVEKSILIYYKLRILNYLLETVSLKVIRSLDERETAQIPG